MRNLRSKKALWIVSLSASVTTRRTRAGGFVGTRHLAPEADAAIRLFLATERGGDDLGARVLDGWPVPLKGYRYRFQVVDSDDINAFAVPTGYIFVTRGLLESLETEHELAAILAHEIAHVESRHSYRRWRNAQNLSMVTGILGALAGGTDNAADDVVAAMTSFTAGLFMAGHGRDREREADLFASFYLNDTDIGDQSLLNSFRKLKFAHDAYDPFGGGGGLFAQPALGRPSLARRGQPRATGGAAWPSRASSSTSPRSACWATSWWSGR